MISQKYKDYYTEWWLPEYWVVMGKRIQVLVKESIIMVKVWLKDISI
jgi:Uma2 family endonuclease